MCTVSIIMKNQTLISLDITHSSFNLSQKTLNFLNILFTMNNIFKQYIDCISQFKKKERWLTELIYADQLTNCFWDSSSLFVSVIIYTALETWEVSERVRSQLSQSSYIQNSLWIISCSLRSLFLWVSLHAVFTVWENTRESHWNSFMLNNSWTVSEESRTHSYWLIYTLSQKFEKSVRDSDIRVTHLWKQLMNCQQRLIKSRESVRIFLFKWCWTTNCVVRTTVLVHDCHQSFSLQLSVFNSCETI